MGRRGARRTARDGGIGAHAARDAARALHALLRPRGVAAVRLLAAVALVTVAAQLLAAWHAHAVMAGASALEGVPLGGIASDQAPSAQYSRLLPPPPSPAAALQQGQAAQQAASGRFAGVRAAVGRVTDPVRELARPLTSSVSAMLGQGAGAGAEAHDGDARHDSAGAAEQMSQEQRLRDAGLLPLDMGRKGAAGSKSSVLVAARAGAGADRAAKDGGDAGLGASSAGQASAHSLPIAVEGAMPAPLVLVFCYNRAESLSATLESLATLRGLERFEVVVSQDGDLAAVAAVARDFVAPEGAVGRRARAASHWTRDRKPLAGAKQQGQAYVAQHYMWALGRAFGERGASHVLIVEDDMTFAPDFLAFFEATARQLDSDPTLLAVSSWNDNGMAPAVRAAHSDDPAGQERVLRRTSYFPGLGWLMRRALWEEIGPAWPLENWDHWLRLSRVSKGRDTLYPEIGRNYNIGRKGANMQSAQYDKYLKHVAVSTGALMPPAEGVTDAGTMPPGGIGRALGDLAYVQRPAYEAEIVALLASAFEVSDWRAAHSAEDVARAAEAAGAAQGDALLLVYRQEEYASAAALFQLWPTPRGHYKHALLLRGAAAGDAGVAHDVLLADARQCALLPEPLRLRPPAELEAVPAKRAQTCAAACRDARGASGAALRCDEQSFWFINSCESLAEHFACERGCALVLGEDVPNYVVDASLNTYRQCLVNERQPKCDAHHPATARLCPCVP